MNFYYHGAWRMDWGMGNPNTTATLIACLMIGVWAVAYRWRRGFWLVLPLFTALGWCLVQTYSRGGMVALLAGLGVLVSWTPRPWPRARWMALAAALAGLGLLALEAGAWSRYGQGLLSEDESITNRLVIWRHFPAMLAAAPFGWGWGAAGDAYTQWFQPSDESVNYLNLINSHLTCMAEGGWAFAILYIYGWWLVLALCWLRQEWRMRAVPLAVWVALGVGACFSHVERSVWLWLPPLFFLGLVLRERWRRRQWLSWRGAWPGLLVSVGAVTVLATLGTMAESMPITAGRGVVVIGRGPETKLILVDRAVLGKLYGHTLRKYLEEHPDLLAGATFVISESANDGIPKDVRQIVIAGKRVHDIRLDQDLGQSSRIALINPDCFPEEMPGPGTWAGRTEAFLGEYSQSPARGSWMDDPSVKSHVVEGAGDFVPSWPRIVWKSI